MAGAFGGAGTGVRGAVRGVTGAGCGEKPQMKFTAGFFSVKCLRWVG